MAAAVEALDSLQPFTVDKDEALYSKAYDLSCALITHLVSEMGKHGMLDGAEVCDGCGELQGTITKVNEPSYSGERFIEGVRYELDHLAEECGRLGGAYALARQHLGVQLRHHRAGSGPARRPDREGGPSPASRESATRSD